MTQSTNSNATHVAIERATTLNRRYVRRPGALTSREGTLLERTAPAVIPVNSTTTTAKTSRSPLKLTVTTPEEEVPTPEPVEKPSATPATTKSRKTQLSEAKRRQQIRYAQVAQAQQAQIQAQQAQAQKDRATDAALQTAALESVATENMNKKDRKQKFKDPHRFRRFLTAFAASTACVIALGLIVKMNMPDLSVRVAAVQTGIDATYPAYIPTDYQLAGVSTEKDGLVTLEFTSNTGSFTLSEEKSSWDSNALLNNYVKSEWGNDYVVVREQGITIYISSSDAAWVNGGICYKLTAKAADTLSKKQIKNIVTSL